jgi:hypothetical protein
LISSSKTRENRSILVIKDDRWVDVDVALGLVNFANEMTLSIQTATQMLIILSFLCHPSLNINNQVSAILNSVSRLNVPTTVLAPLLLQISKHPGDFDQATKFFEKFRMEIVPSIELVENATNGMTLFLNSLHDYADFQSRFVALLEQPFAEASPAREVSFDGSRLHIQKYHNRIERHVLHSLHIGEIKSEPKLQNYFDSLVKPVFFCQSRHRHKVRGQITGEVKWSAECQFVKHDKVRAGRFTVTDDGYFFLSHKVVSICAAQVLFLFWGWHHHEKNSFSIFTTTRKFHLFRIPGQTILRFLPALASIPLPKCVFFQKLPSQVSLDIVGVIQKWRNRHITNFEYIMWLNIFSGRSFHDSEMYPIFPLLFYSDSDGNRRIRDLTQHVLSRRQNDSFDFVDFEFSETYSTRQSVSALRATSPLNFIQVNSELIPELFYLPEVVAGRELPKWCRSASDLIAQHATFLESEQVSSVLHKWIDLIWGICQSDSFDPRLCSTIWDFAIVDPSSIHALLATNGQVPAQLFTGPHPARLPERRSTEHQAHPTSGRLLDLIVTGSSWPTLRLTTLDVDSILYVHNTPSVQLPKWLDVASFADPPSVAFARHCGSSVFFYDKQSVLVANVHATHVSALAAGTAVVVSASEDGVVCAWSHEMKLIGRHFVHKRCVSCVCVADEFGVAVSCDVEGTVVVATLPGLSCMTVAETRQAMGSVVVVPKCGNIVVFAESMWSVWTLSGTKIIERNGAVVRAACGTPNMVALAGEDGEVAVYDAWTLERVRVVYRATVGVVMLRWHQPANAIVCVKADNVAVIVRLATCP